MKDAKVISITHVITSLDQGGAEAMLLKLLQRLDRARFRHSVISLTTRGIHGAEVEACGAGLTALGLDGFASLPVCASRLYRAIRAQQPAIVQTWLYHSDFLGLLVTRLACNAPVAWNVRCAIPEPALVPLATRWLVSLLARISGRPEAVLFNSVSGLAAHRAIGYRPRYCEVIPNGFDLDEWRPDQGRRLRFREGIGVPADTFLVGMTARYHPIKDHRCFLAAAAVVVARYPEVRFVLAGSGIEWNNAELANDIDLHGLRDHVILAGVRNDMPDVMAGIDCLVLTSTSEGFPNVLGEAMACGVPCIATDVGDARQIVGDTGWVVPVRNAGAVAAGLASLLGDTAEARMSRAASCRERIHENYSLDRISARYESLYRSLHEQAAAGDLR